MNWGDPSERAALMERVGIAEFNRMWREHQDANIITKVNGHPIRGVNSRFGRLYAVGNTGRAFGTRAEAEAFANAQKAG